MSFDVDDKEIAELKRRIRRRNYGVLLAILGALGIVVSTIFFNNYHILSYGSQAAFCFGVVAILAVGHPRCPNCGKHFFMRWLGRVPFGPSNILSKSCVNCGWGTNDPAM